MIAMGKEFFKHKIEVSAAMVFFHFANTLKRVASTVITISTSCAL